MRLQRDNSHSLLRHLVHLGRAGLGLASWHARLDRRVPVSLGHRHVLRLLPAEERSPPQVHLLRLYRLLRPSSHLLDSGHCLDPCHRLERIRGG